MDEMILLMGHGSRDPEGVSEFLELAAAVREAAPAGQAIEVGILEFSGPEVSSIQEAIDRCVAVGARRVFAVPVLLFNAGHAKEDMPSQIAQGRARHPGLDLRLAPPLGIHRSLLEITEERLAELERQFFVGHPEATAVLLVGRGTSDAEANGDLFKIGRLLWERNHYGLVECCFAGTAAPLVTEGIDRCVRLGAEQIFVIPYFLNTGILVKRIHAQAQAARAVYPGVEIAVGEHLGVHPKLVQLILSRAKTLAGEGNGNDGMGDGPVERPWRYVRLPYHRHHESSGLGTPSGGFSTARSRGSGTPVIVAYFDGPAVPTSEMLLGSLLDAGMSEDLLRAALGKLRLDGWKLTVTKDVALGVAGRRVDIRPDASVGTALIGASVSIDDLADLVQRSELDSASRATTLRIVDTLATLIGASPGHGERKALRLSIAESVLMLVTTVGIVAGLDALGVQQVFASPALAVLGSDSSLANLEAVLGTSPASLGSIAFLKSLATFRQPSMHLDRVGCGLGWSEDGLPSMVRLWLGEAIDFSPLGKGVGCQGDLPDRKQPMSSAPLKFLPDGSVDWGSMWQTFCELALDGGPPHRGTMLHAPPGADPARPAYQAAVREIMRGVTAVSGLTANTAGESGWIAIQCDSPEMARWLATAILAENVEARFAGDSLFVPVAENFELEHEIKNVITAVAKTTHYWREHRSG